MKLEGFLSTEDGDEARAIDKNGNKIQTFKEKTNSDKELKWLHRTLENILYLKEMTKALAMS